ncbi:MAG: 7-carboxy-7-deazaguanine synthase QueE [Candidatus Omnitrophica bacterium]|nr:7-carboxy-7-deazaguanine synthase QueE [Candidatus Omnitrophota bacterium]MBU0881778.1 7-carboxy-7-deazaguanine synthase QueE [Candidatus Omnitrophota bacterium]MBU0895396.1 7-carboxy-7-deazaguanine synthase QueE [Candidatus Omnitrophota bacterium]MBU1038029.1 7-carboxy-7-deazaguanine synthase QueE [Candidatus Omnitrophota bacterium]MBU1808911.1 7-carboxy-7-deazaguanine synthase QueE [Candidatus Omnitrophota bacterium]
MHKISAEITEIFSSIQGEGLFVGAKQIFVRFKDCNLSCGFCDESKNARGKIYTPAELVNEIRRLAEQNGMHHSISLTGGEPLCYTNFLSHFLPLLHKDSGKSYLETNGTLPDELSRIIDLIDIIAMDIKLPSSTGGRAFWKEHLEFLKIASRKMVFLKAIVTSETTSGDIRRAVSLIKGLGKNIPFILQPVTPVKVSDKRIDKKTLLEFLDIGIENKLECIRVIPQTHKMMGMR